MKWISGNQYLLKKISHKIQHFPVTLSWSRNTGFFAGSRTRANAATTASRPADRLLEEWSEEIASIAL
jgi:hypothetical protein